MSSKNGTIDPSKVLGLIPARGGSKSVPLKNMALLGGVPLISYVIAAAHKSPLIGRTVCSTDHEKISEFCKTKDIEVIHRPKELSGDDISSLAVVKHVLDCIPKQDLPEYVVLLQPTSAFLRVNDIENCIMALENDREADSSQTISPVRHNNHAYNQRIVDGNYVSFRFIEERKICHNKQSKPEHYTFGNLVVTRTRTILEQSDIWGRKSAYVPIHHFYAFDVDDKDDFKLAEAILKSGILDLPIFE